jgi:hypothetical protein
MITDLSNCVCGGGGRGDMRWRGTITSNCHRGLQVLVRQKYPGVVLTHSMIHRQAIAWKDSSPVMNSVPPAAINILHYIKSHCDTSRKVAGSIPDGVFGVYHLLNPSCRTVALVLTQVLREMSTSGVLCGWRRPMPRADNLVTFLCWLSRNSGRLNLLEPEVSVQVSIGIPLPLPLSLSFT